MLSNNFSNIKNYYKDLVIAWSIFIFVIALSILLAWRFNPLPVVFSETFDDNERNQQYLPCAAFTIVDERLRITVTEPHSGCAVRLPELYNDFTFTASAYPVQDVYDGSINILYRQNTNGWYEIQFRPKEQQFNFMELSKNDKEETSIKFTTGWMQTKGVILNDSENKIRLTVTDHWMDFWFNDDPIFRFVTSDKLSLAQGIISIGVGAGEKGGIAFEYDNIEIRIEKAYSRWFYNLQGIKESRKYTDK